GLKDFVRKELRAGRRKGFVRNIGSLSGFDQFTWHLSRCTPIRYSPVPETQNTAIAETIRSQNPVLEKLEVEHAGHAVCLSRPILPFEQGSAKVPDDMLIREDIEEKGMKARGFLAGYDSVIFPAEFRGVTVRVRGVAIGEPGFLGAELFLTGANRAALSQI